MMNFFGAGGGGGTSAGGPLLKVFAAASLAGDCGLLSDIISLGAESSTDFFFVPESCRDLAGFVLFDGFVPAAGGALSAGALADGEGSGAGVVAATALGLSILLTWRLLITVLTPATLAACLPAALALASG